MATQPVLEFVSYLKVSVAPLVRKNVTSGTLFNQENKETNVRIRPLRVSKRESVNRTKYTLRKAIDRSKTLKMNSFLNTFTASETVA